MPAAGYSSRRQKRPARQNSSDIEDARQTQDAPVEDEVSEEEPERETKAIKAKKEKKKGKGKAIPRGGEGEELAALEDQSDDDRIDLNQFPEQPLSRAEASRLKGMAADWRSARSSIFTATDFLPTLGSALAEATGDEDSEELKALDQLVRENIDCLAEAEQNAQAIEAMFNDIAAGQKLAGAPHLFEHEYLKRALNEYFGKTERQKYAKDARYTEFRTNVWNVFHPGEPMPALSSTFDREEGDDESDGEDIEVGGSTQTFKCPITLGPLTNPFTSTTCGHSFDADAIKELCKKNHGVAECPTAGCRARFSLRDCKPDPELAQKAKAHFRRMKIAVEAADDDDDDEVIE